MRIGILVLALLATHFSSAALAARETARFNTCAHYAGHPWEPGMAGKGVEWDEIADTDFAILVCEQALEEQPAEPISQFRLARSLMQVKRYPEAMELLWLSAAAGYSPAQTALGTAHLTGVGAERDAREAEKWLKRAVAQGHVIALTNLGLMYSSIGLGGLPRNEREAMRLHRLSADQGYALAQANLGLHYRYGVGTDLNLAEAKRLFELSAAQDDPAGQSRLGELLINGPQAYRDVPRAIDLLGRAASKDNSLAHLELGIAYFTGVGVMSDLFAARAHLERAEAQGLLSSLFYLARLYEDDSGIERDDAKAFDYHMRAAEAGFPRAIYLVGLAYHLGDGVDQDSGRAEAWLSRAAAIGVPDAQYLLARLLLENKRTELLGKALEYAESAGYAGLGQGFLLLVDHYIALGQWERALGYTTLTLQMPGYENTARWKIKQIKPNLPPRNAPIDGPLAG